MKLSRTPWPLIVGCLTLAGAVSSHASEAVKVSAGASVKDGLASSPGTRDGGNITKKLALEYLTRHAPAVLKSQREDGAFFPYPEWKDPSRYHQYCLYPLAYLYVTPEAGKYHHDPALLNAVRASMRYMSGLIKPDGRSAHFSRGGYWGEALDEWWTYFALETWPLVRPELSVEENALWSQTIRRSVDGCVAHVGGVLAKPNWLNPADVQNHFVCHLLAVYRAGEVFARADWRRLAEGGFQRVIAAQQPAGYWHEGGGPSTLYNHVTTWAVSRYAWESNDPAAWQAVRKAEEFHRAFTYPNGVPVETIDGRVRYTGHTVSIIPSGFTRSPAGQAYVRHQITSLLSQPFEDGYQGYAFFTDVARFAGDAKADSSPPPPVYTLPNRLAGIIRTQGWVAVASAIVKPPTAENRWWQDRQQHLSLWHPRTDLIVGGGNTKGQPLFSTFVVEDASGKVLSHLAKAAELRRAEPAKLELALTLADEQVELTAEILNANTARLTARWHGSGSARYVWQLPLWLAREAGLDVGGKHLALTGESLALSGARLGTELKHRALRLRWEHAPEASFIWPVLPFNPYKKEGVADLASAQGVLRIPLTRTQPIQVTIIVQD